MSDYLANVDLHEVYKALDDATLQRLCDEAEAAGAQNEACFWRNALNAYRQMAAIDSPDSEINRIKDKLVEALAPLKVYLFGSYAAGRANEDSDLDFYVVVKNGTQNLVGLTTDAYKAIRSVRTKAVDIIVGTESGFEGGKNHGGVESEVRKKGVLLYG